jgi:hypothetical protein
VTSLQVIRRAALTVGTALAAVVVASTAAGASSGNGYQEGGESGVGLTVVETLVLFVVAPAVLFGLIALIVIGPSLGKGARHRPGTALETGPVWIDSTGARRTPSDTVVPDGPVGTEQGGTSAHW